MSPDWCTNRLTVSGPPESVARLVAAARDPQTSAPLSFEQLLPTPPELVSAEGADADADEQLARWRLAFWGVTHDVEPADIKFAQSAGVARYQFLTQWDPPFPVAIWGACHFPDLYVELLAFAEDLAIASCDRYASGYVTRVRTGSPSERVDLLREYGWNQAAVATEEQVAAYGWTPNPFLAMFDAYVPQRLVRRRRWASGSTGAREAV